MSLHLALAIIAAGLALVVGGLAVAASVRGAMARFAMDRAILATEAVVAVAIVTGLVQLGATSGPRDGLHLLYAAVALLALPVARAWRGGRRGPQPLPLAIGALVLLGVLVRLAQTG